MPPALRLLASLLMSLLFVLFFSFFTPNGRLERVSFLPFIPKCGAVEISELEFLLYRFDTCCIHLWMQRCTVRSGGASFDSLVVCFCALIRKYERALGRVNKLEKKKVMMGVEAV